MGKTVKAVKTAKPAVKTAKKAPVKKVGSSKMNGTITTFEPDVEIFKEVALKNKDFGFMMSKDVTNPGWEKEMKDKLGKEIKKLRPGDYIYKAFEKLYPEYKGKLVEIITSDDPRAQKTLDDFKKLDFPRVTISVDMLDTGVDIPEVISRN